MKKIEGGIGLLNDLPGFIGLTAVYWATICQALSWVPLTQRWARQYCPCPVELIVSRSHAKGQTAMETIASDFSSSERSTPTMGTCLVRQLFSSLDLAVHLLHVFLSLEISCQFTFLHLTIESRSLTNPSWGLSTEFVVFAFVDFLLFALGRCVQSALGCERTKWLISCRLREVRPT